MADSNNRIKIDFDVNAAELKEITSAINILEKFNKQASQVVNALGQIGGTFDNGAKKAKAAKSEYVNLDRAMNAWNDRLKTNQSMMVSQEAAQAKLTSKLRQYGRDVKVSVDETGKLSASFKNAEGNIVSMTGKYDAATNAIKNMKTTLSTAALEVKAKAEADKKAAQAMDRLHVAANKLNREIDNQKKKFAELTRGTDLKHILLANGDAFNIMTRAVKANAEVVRASSDRNGKFSQTLRMQDGSLRTVTGYYDAAKKKLIQYSESVSKADGNIKKATSSTQRFGSMLTNLERSMQGLNKYTLTWSEAIEIAGTRMLQWNVAGTVIFGLQRAFKGLLSTIVELDSQMIQLVRVLPDTTNFNELMEDSIRLSTEFGRTLTDINEAMITFARSGFDNVDTRFLSEAATLMANVSDIDMFDASESITSAITLFNIEARDAIQVVNKLNEVDNDYSISTQQLAKSITRAGGTASAFGVDLNELLGHTTAIGVATRESGQIIGNSLKTIYSRINTLPKAREAIEELGIAMTLPNGDNRDVADIMDDLAAKWPELNNAKKQSAAMDIAGTYQLSRFLAMMNNYQMGLDATTTAQHSYNSAVEENAKFMQGLEAKINLLKSSAQQLAMALGKAGVYAAIQITLEALTNLTQGFIKITDTFGKFTFVIPVAAAAVGLLVAQFQKTRLEMVAFQAAMLGMNTNLSRQALMMAGTATTSTILTGAFATLRTAAIGLTTALLTNPLTWIAVAITAIPMLIGHFQRLKAEQEALHKRAQDNSKAFKDFKKEIEAGNVNQTSLDVYTSKMDVAEKTLKKLKDAQTKSKEAQELAAKTMSSMSGEYSMMNSSIMSHVNWQDNLSKKTKEELADLGIKYDKYEDIKSLMAEVKLKQDEYGAAVSAGNDVLKDAKKQLMFHADAFDEVGESVQETMDIMQLFFGVNDQMVQELIGSYNAIMVLSKVKDKDQAQTEALEQAYSVWGARLGLSREELMKNPDAMKENIKWQEKMSEKWGEETGKILSNEEQKQIALDITKQKSKETANQTTADEAAAAEEKIRAAKKEAKEKGALFSKTRANMILNGELNLGYTQKEVANATKRSSANGDSSKKTIQSLVNESGQTKKTGSSFDALKNMQDAANKSRVSSQMGGSAKVKDELEKERAKTKTTGKSFSDMATKAALANAGISSTTSTSSSRTVSSLDSAKSKTNELKTAWEKLKQIFKNPIAGVATLSISKIVKNIVGGSGGGTDPIQTLGQGAGTDSMRSLGGTMQGLTKTSGFGMRRDPFTGTQQMHTGVDFAGPTGKAIRSNVSGQVIFSGYGQKGTGYGGFGNVVAIRDTQGLTHIFAHNSSNYAKTGSFVQAGQTIAALGSTGNSTGPHSHYEVRAGNKAINPMASLGGGSDTATKRNNEMDVRVLKGEMILTKQQQNQLFGMAGIKKPKYHTGGIAGGSSWKNAGSFSGVGGSYTVRSGDTLGELAEKFKTTVKNLMAMNKSIKDANKLYIGQKIVYGSSSSGGKTGSSKTTKPQTKAEKEKAAKAAKAAADKKKAIQDKADNAVQSNKSYMSYIQGLGLQNDSTYTTKKLKDNRSHYVKASTDNQRDYNTQYSEALKKYTNVNDAKKAFNGAGFFGLDKNYKNKLWKEVEKSVKANIVEKNDNKASSMNSYVDYMQGMGAKGYDTPQYMTWKLKANESTFKGASAETQKDYNTQMAQALADYDNLEEARKKFQSAAWFGLNKEQKNSVWAGIEEAVKSNAFEKLDDSTKAWLDTFNNGLTEANEKVSNWLSTIEDIQNAQASATKDKYIDSTVAAGMEKLGMGDNLTPEEVMKKRMDEIKAETEKRLTQNAELAYANDPAELQKRLDEIEKKRKLVEDQIKATTSSSVSNGLSAANQAKLLEPLQEALAALNEEYKLLNDSSGDAANITSGNTTAVEALAKEYADLMKQIEATTLKEKVDEFGNIVRNLSGAAANAAATVAIAASGNEMVIDPPSANVTSTGLPVSYSESNESKNPEPKVYDAGVAAKNVTYIINTGVAIGSESELREFAMLLKGMMDEEEGRSES